MTPSRVVTIRDCAAIVTCISNTRAETSAACSKALPIWWASCGAWRQSWSSSLSSSASQSVRPRKRRARLGSQTLSSLGWCRTKAHAKNTGNTHTHTHAHTRTHTRAHALARSDTLTKRLRPRRARKVAAREATTHVVLASDLGFAPVRFERAPENSEGARLFVRAFLPLAICAPHSRGQATCAMPHCFMCLFKARCATSSWQNSHGTRRWGQCARCSARRCRGTEAEQPSTSHATSWNWQSLLRWPGRSASLPVHAHPLPPAAAAGDVAPVPLLARLARGLARACARACDGAAAAAERHVSLGSAPTGISPCSRRGAAPKTWHPRRAQAGRGPSCHPTHPLVPRNTLLMGPQFPGTDGTSGPRSTGPAIRRSTGRQHWTLGLEARLH